MKKLLLLLGLALAGHIARAELATNYLEFTLKFTPSFSLNPGPHSTQPYPPSLTVITYESDSGTITEVLTNNTAQFDLSSLIAAPELSLTVAQPLWNAMAAGTNGPVTFGTLTLSGLTLATNAFSATNIFESWAESKHWMSWSVVFNTGSEGSITANMTGGSGFGAEASLLWSESLKRDGTSLFPIQWRDAAYPFRSYQGDVWPGFQDYLRTGRVNPYDQPHQNVPQFWDDPADTNTVYYLQTNLNTGAEGYILYVVDATNRWEFVRTKVQVPMANGDTNAPN